jgi:quercetin dioxygenase-like cupin family protein
MKVYTQVWNGTVTSVYLLNKGDHIGGGRHRHLVNHTTHVVSGSLLAAIYADSEHRLIRLDEGDIYVLPMNVDHDLMAIVDDTIAVNCIAEQAVAGMDGRAGELVFE